MVWGSDRAELVSKLDALVTARLFGPGEWLADREQASAVGETLFDLKLKERVAGHDGTTRSTALGNELDVDLLLVFFGLWEPWDAIMVLQGYELLDETDADDLWDAVGNQKDSERLLRKRAQTAYFKYFQVRSFH